ncbi:MAG: hypothetical protein J6T23_04535 [Elusimicrobia bacterium]|nr:hypothetical protein [Elusimicrobiota bacterium]
MKKNLILSFLFCCFAVSSVFPADAKEMFKNAFDKVETLKKQGISYTLHAVAGNSNKKSVTAKVYMKGDRIRIEAKEGISIIDENSMYIYSEQEKTAMKMNVDKETIKQTTFDAIQDKADELKLVEKASKNGYSCQVFKSKDNDSDVVYYLTDDYGLPTYVKEEASETNITNFKTGKIDDNLFVLPKGTNIIDMANFSPESLIQNMQQNFGD